MSIAIITGASSGLGQAYVTATTRVFPEIEEIWVVARRQERLQQLAAEFPDKRIMPVVADLSRTADIQKIQDKLAEEKPQIALLVGAAGIAGGGAFAEETMEHIQQVINLNCLGTTLLTRAYMPYMQDGGTILLVSSTSAFVPNTNLVVYSASKSYVTAFCLGIREELKPRHINVCSVHPGVMHTEMASTFNEKQYRLPAVDVPKHAERSLRAAKRGADSYTTGWFYRCYRLLAKILPNKWVVRFVGL